MQKDRKEDRSYIVTECDSCMHNKAVSDDGSIGAKAKA